MTLKLKSRKIISISYTFLVSLPKEWTHYHDIGKHDKVSVEIGDDEEGRALILRPLKDKKECEKEEEHLRPK